MKSKKECIVWSEPHKRELRREGERERERERERARSEIVLALDHVFAKCRFR